MPTFNPEDNLHKAANEGDLHLISEEKDIAVINRRHSVYESTALCFAFESNHPAIIQHLLERENILLSYRDGACWQTAFGIDYWKGTPEDAKNEAFLSCVGIYQQKILASVNNALAATDENVITDVALLCLGLIYFYKQNDITISNQLTTAFISLCEKIKSPFVQNLVFLKALTFRDDFFAKLKCNLTFTEFDQLPTLGEAQIKSLAQHEAMAAAVYQKAEKWDQALKHFDLAAKILGSIAKTHKEQCLVATYYNRAGISCEKSSLGYPKALEYYQKAINEQEKAIQTAILESKSDNNESTSSYCQCCGDKVFSLSVVLANVGNMNKSLQQWQEAAEYYSKAAEKLETTEVKTEHEQRHLAQWQNDSAVNSNKKSPPDKKTSLHYHEKAIQTQRGVVKDTENKQDIRNLAIYLYDAAIIYKDLSQYNKSETYCIEAINLREKVIETQDDQRCLAIYQNQLGVIYSKMTFSEKQKALQHYNKAIQTQREIIKITGNSSDKKTQDIRQLSLFINNAGYIYTELEMWQEAAEHYNEAAKHRKTVVETKEDEQYLAEYLNNFVLIYPEIAPEKINEALRNDFIATRHQQGNHYQQSSQWEQAAQAYSQTAVEMEKAAKTAADLRRLANYQQQAGEMYAKIPSSDNLLKASEYYTKAQRTLEKIDENKRIDADRNNLTTLSELFRATLAKLATLKPNSNAHMGSKAKPLAGASIAKQLSALPQSSSHNKKHRKKGPLNSQTSTGTETVSGTENKTVSSPQVKLDEINRKMNLVIHTANCYGGRTKTNIENKKSDWQTRLKNLTIFNGDISEFHSESQQLIHDLDNALQTMNDLPSPARPFSRKAKKAQKTGSTEGQSAGAKTQKTTNTSSSSKKTEVDHNQKLPASKPATNSFGDRLARASLPQEQKFDTLAQQNQMNLILNKSSHTVTDYPKEAQALLVTNHKPPKTKRPQKTKTKPFVLTSPSRRQIDLQQRSLKCASAHLARLAEIYHQAITDGPSTIDQGYQLEITHYALLRHINRIFIALAIYSRNKGQMPGNLNKELIDNMHAITRHHQNWPHHEVLAAAKELIGNLSQDMAQLMPQLEPKQQDAVAIYRQSEAAEEKVSYLQINQFYLKKSHEPILQSLVHVRDKIIPIIKRIMSKEHLGKEGERLCSNVQEITKKYPLEIDALKALLTETGRRYSTRRKNLYDKDQPLDTFMQTCREIYNKENYDLKGCDLQKVFEFSMNIPGAASQEEHDEVLMDQLNRYRYSIFSHSAPLANPSSSVSTTNSASTLRH